jgi:general secretion pathway protein I
VTHARSPEAGFTLIETLVALAVLAITAVGLLAATEAHIGRIAALETRAAAMWAAENYLAEVTLGLTPEAGPAPILGVQFALEAAVEQTTDPDLSQITITATDARDGRAYASLTGFVLNDRLAVLP